MGLISTQLFHFAEKFKSFGVGHLYSAVGKSKPLRESQLDGSHPLLGFSILIGSPNHSELDTSTPLLKNPNARRTATRWVSPPLSLSTMLGNLKHLESDTSTPLFENPNHSEETGTRWVSPLTRPFPSALRSDWSL